MLDKHTGARVPKRQVEELTVRAAQDFDEFYAARLREPEATDALLVLSFDGKGIAMRHEDLRAATRKERDAKRPRPVNKRVWASLEHSAQQVVDDAFAEGLRRASERQRRWVVLVDGQPDQLKRVQQYAKALTQLATKYQLSTRTSSLDKIPAPAELLDQLTRWLRKHVSSPQLLRALLKRIDRLRLEIRTFF